MSFALAASCARAAPAICRRTSAFDVTAMRSTPSRVARSVIAVEPEIDFWEKSGVNRTS
jgi:hypothetical protein